MAKQLRSRRTREQLAQAARHMFENMPYPQVTMRLIAQQAGRAHSSAFRYWRNKAELWTEVMGYEPPVDRLESRKSGRSPTTREADIAALRAIAAHVQTLGQFDVARELESVADRLDRPFEPPREPAVIVQRIGQATLKLGPQDSGVATDRTEIFEQHIAARLKTLRTAQGLTLGDLARALDASIMQVSRYETGKSPISAGRLARLATVFGWALDLVSRPDP